MEIFLHFHQRETGTVKMIAYRERCPPRVGDTVAIRLEQEHGTKEIELIVKKVSFKFLELDDGTFKLYMVSVWCEEE